jgi:hypothetical protein
MSANKPRGKPVEWTTEEQKAWLEDQKPAYTSAQMNGAKKFSLFWAATFEEWLRRWPNEPPTEQEKSEGVDEAEKMKRMKSVSN